MRESGFEHQSKNKDLRFVVRVLQHLRCYAICVCFANAQQKLIVCVSEVLEAKELQFCTDYVCVPGHSVLDDSQCLLLKCTACG